MSEAAVCSGQEWHPTWLPSFPQTELVHRFPDLELRDRVHFIVPYETLVR